MLTVLELKAADGQADEVEAMLEEHLGDTRAGQGCELRTVYPDLPTSGTVRASTTWTRSRTSNVHT